MTHYPFSTSLPGGRKRTVISTMFRVQDKNVHKRNELDTRELSKCSHGTMSPLPGRQTMDPISLVPFSKH